MLDLCEKPCIIMHINQNKAAAESAREIQRRKKYENQKTCHCIACSALTAGSAFGLAACDETTSGNDAALPDEITKLQQQLSEVQKDLDDMKKKDEEPADESVWNFGAESYEKLKYIDKGLSDRDCFAGKHFKYTQNWIAYTLKTRDIRAKISNIRTWRFPHTRRKT